MKKLWLLLLIITPLRLIHAQEVQHATTVEQCRANQKLWDSMLLDPNGAVANVSYKELKGWFDEMQKCELVDPEFGTKYYNTYAGAAAQQRLRLQKFLDRHNLWNKFQAEDAQGKGR